MLSAQTARKHNSLNTVLHVYVNKGLLYICAKLRRQDALRSKFKTCDTAILRQTNDVLNCYTYKFSCGSDVKSSKHDAK